MGINISARDIRAFLAVSDTRNFSLAAQQMHLSQSALSTLIVRLEEAFGTRLFDRTTRTVTLTAAGSVLLSHADQLLSDLERVVAAVRDVTTLRKGSVTVAALPSLAARIVPGLFRTFGEIHPDIKLSLIDTLYEPAFELVREGRVDFALTAANPSYTDLDYVPLTTDNFVLLMAESHSLALESGHLSFTDTLAWPHVSMPRQSNIRQYVDAAALQHGIQFLPAYELDNVTTIAGMVAADLGVAVLPSITVDGVRGAGLAVRQLTNPSISRSIGFVKRKEGSLSPAAEVLVSLLQGQFSNNRQPAQILASNYTGC
jgi:DNA-binding transcriptional LysR family regulator